MGWPTLVVWDRTCLSKVVATCTHVSISPRSLPRLHIWHARSRCIGTFTPFPIIIDYGDEDREVTEQDEEGILLALRRRRRLRHIRLWMPASNLQKLVVVMNGEFPMLEYLHINPLTSDDIGLSLPATFKGPLLHHFSLRNVTSSYSLSKPHPPLSAPRVQSTERIGLCSGCSGP